MHRRNKSTQSSLSFVPEQSVQANSILTLDACKQTHQGVRSGAADAMPAFHMCLVLHTESKRGTPALQHPEEAVAKSAALIVQCWRAVMRDAARREQPTAEVQAVLRDSRAALPGLPGDVRLRVAAEAAALPPLSAAVGRLLPPNTPP